MCKFYCLINAVTGNIIKGYNFYPKDQIIMLQVMNTISHEIFTS